MLSIFGQLQVDYVFSLRLIAMASTNLKKTWLTNFCSQAKGIDFELFAEH